MEHVQDMEQQLWEYIDGYLPADRQAIVAGLISQQAAWREKYHELLELHQLVNNMELEQPSLRFTKNVMEEIAKCQIAPATKAYINKKIIWSISGFFIAVIGGFILYSLAQTDWSATKDNTGFIKDSMFTADYSKIFNNAFIQVFMMVNIVLGLLLLDRYLSSRKKQWLQ